MHAFKSFVTFVFSVILVADAADIINSADKRNVIPDSFIVVMKKGISDAAFALHLNKTAEAHQASAALSGNAAITGVKHSYQINGWKGYSGVFNAATLNVIRNNKDVDFIEPDRMASVAAWTTQPNAPSWGLARISQRVPRNRNYVFDDAAGRGIIVYGLDSGIFLQHPDFQGRATFGVNTVGGSDNDNHGHGTHTAGTIVGVGYGVAKKAHIIAVKVLGDDGRGPWSGIIQGVEWAVNDARRRGIQNRAVINMSIGGAREEAVNQAVNAANDAGLFVVVSAGNDAIDTVRVSPGSAERVCTVAASDERDNRATFSNYGAPVKIYAPGTNIRSTLRTGGVGPMSGTSMSAPHVAGQGAIVLSMFPGARANTLCEHLRRTAIPSVPNPGPRTTNLLLYNGSPNGQ
ncbi:Secreted subtilisin-like serine protease sub11 [Myotisia sp. PD_48]|nr:Secreted subtilisin-like serine protease sub11 [Myotisia sp. PD_48]